MDTVHVVPVKDLIVHTTDDDECVCGPDVQFRPKGNVVIHHSLDGREKTESDDIGNWGSKRQ